MITSPNNLTVITPFLRHVVRLSNLIKLGGKIDINDLSMEEVYYIEYFGMRRQKAEDTARFKALFDGLVKLFNALARCIRGKI